MRVGFAGVGAFHDTHWLDPVADDDRGDVGQIGEKLLEPLFQVEAVPQYQAGALCADNVLRRWLVVVYLRTGLGYGDHFGSVSCHIGRHVGDDGEGGDDLQFCMGALRHGEHGAGQRCQDCEQFQVLTHIHSSDYRVACNHFMQMQTICNKEI